MPAPAAAPARPARPRHAWPLLCFAALAASASASPLPHRITPQSLCTPAPGANVSASTAALLRSSLALVSAYAPFPDPGMGWGHTLLPLISIRPKLLDRWVRRTPLFCAVTPDAKKEGPSASASSLILTRAKSVPHANSHATTRMAAFHWCRLSGEDVAGLAGRGGAVRLVDAATAAALLQAGRDDGRSVGEDLACAGSVRFPPPVRSPHPLPGQGGVGGAPTGFVLTEKGAAPLPLPPPPSFETLAACVGPLYGDAPWGLVSWFEHHLDAGIGHFYMYVVAEEWTPASNPVHAVLAHYASKKLATIRDWTPLGGASSTHANGSWYFNQAALHNDCLNRARGRHRHVAFMDTDEFIEAGGWVKKDRDGATGALTRAVRSWTLLPGYEDTHSVGFPCRWHAMLGDAKTRAQLTERDGLESDPADEPAVKEVGGSSHPLPHPPPLAPTPCTEPLLDRLPYRSAAYERTRSKFIARPDATLAVEAHYVLAGAGDDAVFASGALHHNHYFIVRDGVAAHPSAPRPKTPGVNASEQGLVIPIPGMMEVLDEAWPARFVEGGVREKVVREAAAACGGL